MDVMTDKATVSVASPFDGVIQKLLAEPGSQMNVGDVVLSYKHEAPASESGRASKHEAPASESENAARDVNLSTPRRDGPRPQAAPSVRRKARSLGIDLTTLHGSGPAGRVLMKDLEARQPTPTDTQLPSPVPSAGRVENPSYTPGTRIKLHGLRRKIAEAMSQAKRSIPHFSLIDECDVTALVQLRASLKAACESRGVKLTYLAFMVRAAVAALKDVPAINASLDEQAEEIVLHDRYHIGVATATPQGLVVPVIHDADTKDLLTIAAEIDRLTTQARNGQSRLEDLRGGTFTITSIGNIGGLISTPIIRPPEAAIMGAGRIVRRPVYDEHGSLRPADLLYLSFSFDHRLIDGDVAARFAGAVISRLQNPAELLLSVGNDHV
jgi:pyruvate dehydrogenase E2 component (dihydrolipoamide acetyltransferase)/2-oxoisovalerate dehydrogenase E2 component (dihydrolipoyl transacylase)